MQLALTVASLRKLRGAVLSFEQGSLIFWSKRDRRAEQFADRRRPEALCLMSRASAGP